MSSELVLDYKAGLHYCKGSYFQAENTENAPTILVGHTWKGKSDFEIEKARSLSKLGYNALAIDLFGGAKQGSSSQENQAMIEPFVNDRSLLRNTLIETADFSKTLNSFNGKLGMIGFCFGGLATIELARSGYDFVAGVSFHGLLNASNTKTEIIKSSILILHGFKDPMVPPNVVNNFQNELEKYAKDWQFISYGNAYHAFTNPIANDVALGTIYNEAVADDSWSQMLKFFKDRMY
ncbi:MAG: dienelactone hydrolase family protein [Gammaproteobacteria bacterium]